VIEFLFKELKTSVSEMFGANRMMAATRADAPPEIIFRVNRLIINKVVVPAAKVTADNSQKACASGALKASQILAQEGIVIPPALTFTEQKLVETIRLRNLSALTGITDEMGKKIANVLTDDIIKGKGADQIARDINEQVEGIGIARAKVMARTETMYAYNATATARYKAHGIDEEEWLTAHDERTCDVCGPLDGMKFPIGEQDCPAHPNCRCVKLPVIPEVS
jgi:SPP1 gp7 family putative phage head morphogenesis protein